MILVALTAFTVFVISFAYSRVIEEFPGGGGGYLVATKLLGPRLGVVSGCALIVDFLTISVSVVSGVDAIFNRLPLHYHSLKLTTAIAALLLLVILNLRGVKESVTFLLPIFLVFCATHLVLILTAILGRVRELPAVLHATGEDFHKGVGALGFVPMLFILLRAYSMGGGTYTGIEAVSNGVQILREPRVHNAKKTMLYMALSLAFTAGGILFAYLLVHAHPTAGKTMNGVLAGIVFSSWRMAGLPIGSWLVIATLLSEGLLLFVAAQTGFLDGPRVLANMAVDSWAPHRFAQLSDRLVTKNGVLLIGLASAAVMLYARGGLDLLVTMYAINVFLTFTLTELGMSLHWIRDRHAKRRGAKPSVHLTGLVLCFSIPVRDDLRKVPRRRVGDGHGDERLHRARVRDPQALPERARALELPGRGADRGPAPRARGRERADEPEGADRRDPRRRVQRTRHPFFPLDPAALSALLRELPVPLRRRDRLGEVQGGIGDRGAPHLDGGVPPAIRGLRAQARDEGRLPLSPRHRSGG